MQATYVIVKGYVIFSSRKKLFIGLFCYHQVSLCLWLTSAYTQCVGTAVVVTHTPCRTTKSTCTTHIYTCMYTSTYTHICTLSIRHIHPL